MTARPATVPRAATVRVAIAAAVADAAAAVAATVAATAATSPATTRTSLQLQPTTTAAASSGSGRFRFARSLNLDAAPLPTSNTVRDVGHRRLDTPLTADGQTGEQAGKTPGANSASGMLDPVAARMLAKVGDFVEPLTRFDRNDLKLVGCAKQMIEVTASDVTTIAFSIRETEGNGALGAGVRAVDTSDQYIAEGRTMLARARKELTPRLESWSRVNGLDMRAAPRAEDVGVTPYPVGHAWRCETCTGRGEVDCGTCNRAGKVNCQTCGARGRTTCSGCGGQKRVSCGGCAGAGGRWVQVETPYFNAADNRQSVRYEQKWEQCATCHGQQRVDCTTCRATGEVTCTTCHGDGRVTCNACHGSGRIACSACAGYGWKHRVAELVTSITRAFSVKHASDVPEIAAVLNRISNADQLAALASTSQPLPRIGDSSFIRETRTSVMVAEAEFMAGGALSLIRGFGPTLEIHDYKNIAGALLSADLAQLEQATKSAKRFPPHFSAELAESLQRTFTSEAHFAIAEKAGFSLIPGAMSKKADRLASGEFKGVASADYIRRAVRAMANGVTRAYTAEMLRWPAFTLFTPVLALPVNWLMWRFAPTNADMPVTTGFILIAIGAALAGHVMATFSLQKRLGGLKLNRVLDGLGLTWIWMGMASIVALTLTPLMSLIGHTIAGV